MLLFSLKFASVVDGLRKIIEWNNLLIGGYDFHSSILWTADYSTAFFHSGIAVFRTVSS